jgi:hypothetical protein
MTQTQLLDFDDAHDIAVGNNTIAFKKYNNDQIELHYSVKSDNGEYFEESESLFIGDNSSIIVLNSDIDDFGDHGIIWESLIDNEYQLLSFDFWDEEIDTLNYSSPYPMQATILSYEIAIGKNKQPYFTDLALVKTENENQEIFVNSFLSKNSLHNISNSPFQESNPNLFFYSQDFSYNIILTWESTRNNHQQLFLTKERFYANTSELEKSKNHFSIFPNPTSSQINIKLSELVNSDYQIELLDIHQKTIANLYSGDIEPEESLNLKIPNEVANGVYFIRLSSKDFSETRKLLIAK